MQETVGNRILADFPEEYEKASDGQLHYLFTELSRERAVAESNEEREVLGTKISYIDWAAQNKGDTLSNNSKNYPLYLYKAYLY